MVYKRMTRSGMCKLSQQWGCFTYSVQMETSLMSFSVHLLFNIYYISATFPHKLRNFPAQITLLVEVQYIGNSKGRKENPTVVR